MHNLEHLKDELARRCGDFCHHFFPEGQFRYGKFYVGDLAGNRGRSLVINVDGDRAGMWKDFATDEGGSNLLDLLLQKRGGNSLPETYREAMEWLNSPEDYFKNAPQRLPIRTADREMQLLDYRGLVAGSKRDLSRLSDLLGVSWQGIFLTQAQGLLRFFDHPTNGRCWTVLDASHFVRQDRRLDGKSFILKGGEAVKARTLGCPRVPVGLPTKKPVVLLCEGSSDFLVAFHLAYADLKRDDELSIKDLRDFCRVDGGTYEDDYEVRSALGAFIATCTEEATYGAH